MKIMQIVSGHVVNSAMRHCMLLSKELARRGNEVAVVCRPGSWIESRLAQEGLRVIPSELNRWPGNELRELAGVLTDEHFDVIHTHRSRAHHLGVLLRLMTKVPCVATAHSRRLQPQWLMNDLVIAKSAAARRFHQCYNLVPRHRIVTVRGFIEDPPVTSTAPDARRRIREAWGVAPDELLIGSVGSVCARKGTIHLVQAMPRVLAEVPHARLVVIGSLEDEGYVARVRQTVDRLDIASRVQFAGQSDRVPEMLAALDLLASAARKTDLPMAILEAMAAGLPVVATDVGGVAECVHAGRTGMVVPPHDTRALAEAVTSLLLDAETRRRFGHSGRRLVLRSFSKTSQTAAVEAAFARARHVARAA